MRMVCDCACDAGLHILAALTLLLYLAQGLPNREVTARSKLATCRTCQFHYYPEQRHSCDPTRIAYRALP